MGKLVYWLVFLQKSWCLAFTECRRAVVPVISSPTSVSALLTQTVLCVTKRRLQQPALHARPAWGNEGRVAFPLHLLTCLGSNQQVFSARVEVAELHISP